MRGFCAIGIYQPKKSVNVGSLFRTAMIFGAAYTFTIGPRYTPQPSDTVKSWRHMPHFDFETFEQFQDVRPRDARLIGVELIQGATPLASFDHPHSAIYLLGAEDNGLPPKVLARCQRIVVLPGDHSLNVAVAGSIVLYDRIARRSTESTSSTDFRERQAIG